MSPIQAESDTVAGNGRKYVNRYHFYFFFDGDRISQVREYKDVNLVREVFSAKLRSFRLVPGAAAAQTGAAARQSQRGTRETQQR